MKTTFKFLFLCLMLFVASGISEQSNAQKRYAFGDRMVIPIAATSSTYTTISITPPVTLTMYTFSADTNVTFNAVTTRAVPADILMFRIKGNIQSRIITWGTNLDGVSDTIAADKTWMYQFIYDGTAYKKVSKSPTD